MDRHELRNELTELLEEINDIAQSIIDLTKDPHGDGWHSVGYYQAVRLQQLCKNIISDMKGLNDGRDKD
jgi:hypothetical protein